MIAQISSDKVLLAFIMLFSIQGCKDSNSGVGPPPPTFLTGHYSYYGYSTTNTLTVEGSVIITRADSVLAGITNLQRIDTLSSEGNGFEGGSDSLFGRCSKDGKFVIYLRSVYIQGTATVGDIEGTRYWANGPGPLEHILGKFVLRRQYAQ